jgi:hypothetical protein
MAKVCPSCELTYGDDDYFCAFADEHVCDFTAPVDDEFHRLLSVWAIRTVGVVDVVFVRENLAYLSENRQASCT